MAEEHRCQAAPEGPRLCANNCGFFGSPATQGLCSKCYGDFRLKEDQEAAAKIAVEKSLFQASSSSSSSPSPAASSSPILSASTVPVPPPSASADPAPSLCLNPEEPGSTVPPPAPSAQPGRCRGCRKRVGLTGFRCRCGDTYCSAHRYPEQHACTFDFKSAGRDAIARANPVVRADKFDKI